jgi:peroxiredoxin
MSFSQIKKDVNFLISGEIAGRDSGMLVLSYLNKYQKYSVDTAKIKDGKFNFSMAISEPTMAYLIGKTTSSSMEDPNRTIIFLEPNNLDIHLTESQFNNVVVKGSKTQAEYENLNNIQLPYRNRRRSILKSLDSVENLINVSGSTDNLTTRLSLLKNEWSKNSNNLINGEFQFIFKNPNSVISAFLMNSLISRQLLSVDSAIKILASLSPIVRSSTIGKQTQSAIDKKLMLVTGNDAPKFRAKDIDGKIIASEDYKGKNFILLDFWASWCSPCHDQAPYLNKLYDKYRQGGLEIIGISADQNREIWKKAISKDKTERWVHLLMSEEIVPSGVEKMTKRFAVGSYPLLLLIDKKGTIVYMDNGFGGEEQFNTLDALLSKSKD